MNSFIERVIHIIKNIPPGRVISYGQVAALAGNYRAARQVSRILKKYGEKEKLPWHRVVNSKGMISLPEHEGGIIQKGLLENEGVTFIKKRTVIEKKYFWNGSLLQ